MKVAGATLKRMQENDSSSNAPATEDVSSDSKLRRSSIVRIIPDKETEIKLKALCSLASKLWNEINYVRRRQFFETKRVDLKGTYKEFYNKYKMLIGGVTAQQIINKNDETWRSFFNLLRAKKEGRLPPFVARINPPGYKKRGETHLMFKGKVYIQM